MDNEKVSLVEDYLCSNLDGQNPETIELIENLKSFISKNPYILNTIQYTDISNKSLDCVFENNNVSNDISINNDCDLSIISKLDDVINDIKLKKWHKNIKKDLISKITHISKQISSIDV